MNLISNGYWFHRLYNCTSGTHAACPGSYITTFEEECGCNNEACKKLARGALQLWLHFQRMIVSILDSIHGSNHRHTAKPEADRSRSSPWTPIWNHFLKKMDVIFLIGMHTNNPPSLKLKCVLPNYINFTVLIQICMNDFKFDQLRQRMTLKLPNYVNFTVLIQICPTISNFCLIFQSMNPTKPLY